MKKPELLAPAGSFEKAKIAFLYGADAVYCGTESLSLRSRAEVDDNDLEKREIYWIKELSTYGKGGYNATIGGDGKLLYDHNEIIELYRMGYNTSQISQKLNCDTTTITSVLRANGIKSRGRSKMVDQFDLAGNFIQTFDSTKDAEIWLLSKGITANKNAHRVISDCINGRRRNTMYGYKWVAKRFPD